MPAITSNGVEINYIDEVSRLVPVEGEGPPVVLVHGFASSLDGNWRAPGVIDALIAAGRRVIALDCRGHGKSGKPHDPAAYGGAAMADDVLALMDHLGVARADLAGYSMGGFVSATLLVLHPERFRSVILAGVGDGLLGGWSAARGEAIARALESADGANAEDPTARGFRLFAEASGNDLAALAAIQRAFRGSFEPARLSDVTLPVMVLIGEGDTLAGPAGKLAAAIPGAKHVLIPGDHLTAVGQPQFPRAICDFLAEHSPAPAS